MDRHPAAPSPRPYAATTFTPQLAERLAAIARTGIDARALLHTATGAPLPDDHAASALWWRISRHLAPAVAHGVDTALALTPGWVDRLTDAIGAQRATAMQASAWWPALVSVVDHALARGESLDALLSMARDPSTTRSTSTTARPWCWRVSLLTDPAPPDARALAPPPEDCDDDLEWIPPTTPGLEPARPAQVRTPQTPAPVPLRPRTSRPPWRRRPGPHRHGRPGTHPGAGRVDGRPRRAVGRRTLHPAARRAHQRPRAGLLRQPARRRVGRALPARPAPHRPGTDRCRVRPTRVDPPDPPPARHGVTDDEMLAAGLATRARTGTLIDRFRDRLVLPITAEDTVVGVRRTPPPRRRRQPRAEVPQHPHHRRCSTRARCSTGSTSSSSTQAPHPSSSKAPSTPSPSPPPGAGATSASPPLGTSLTETQARLLATLHPEPIVATDADPAGRAAAERAYWLLTQHAVSPRSAALPDGSDPADILHSCGPEALAASIDGAHPLAQDLIDARLAHASGHPSIKDLAAVIAADAPSRWLTQARDLTERTDAKSRADPHRPCRGHAALEPSTLAHRTTTALGGQSTTASLGHRALSANRTRPPSATSRTAARPCPRQRPAPMVRRTARIPGGAWPSGGSGPNRPRPIGAASSGEARLLC